MWVETGNYFDLKKVGALIGGRMTLTWEDGLNALVAEGIEAIVFRTVGDLCSLWESLPPGAGNSGSRIAHSASVTDDEYTTLRRKLVAVPARLARPQRKPVLHLAPPLAVGRRMAPIWDS